MMTYLLGQCPSQLFNKSHPQYSGKNSDTNNFNKINIKNEYKSLPNNIYIYMSESTPSHNGNSENIYFYIVANKEILVYNKQMKNLPNLSVNIQKIFPLFECKTSNKGKNDVNKNINDKTNDNDTIYNNNKQFIYKRLIFDIEDCKFFFIGGYIDNSYKIYLKISIICSTENV